MKRSTFIGILLIVVLALSACATEDNGDTGNANMNDNTNDTLGTEPALSTPDTGGTTGTGTPSTGTGGTPSGGTGGTGTGTPQAGTGGTGTPGIPVTGADCETVTVQLSTNVSGGTGGTGTGTGATTTGTPGTGTGGTASTPAAATGTPGTGTGGTGAGTATAMEPFLVDCNGMALYVFMEDTQDAGTSMCTDADCMAEWPALTVDEGEEPMAGEGVDETLLGTITRDDGTIQVTYNGWPLYLFADDIDPGDTLGQGDEDMWFLISADGEPIQQ